MAQWARPKAWAIQHHELFMNHELSSCPTQVEGDNNNLPVAQAGSTRVPPWHWNTVMQAVPLG